MTRPSRPPGFDMTYRPERRISFGPPLKQQLPSLGYLAFAAIVTAVIIYGQNAPSSSTLFHYVVEGDRTRMIPSSVCAIILCCSAVAAVLREQMRGVVVHPDGIELRELLHLGWPRVRRLHWSQIDRVFVPNANGANEQATDDAEDSGRRTGSKKTISVDLWDGSRAWL